MLRLSLPPRIKVLEAAGSIADGRVEKLESQEIIAYAEVVSSMGDKRYRVVLKRLTHETLLVFSDDNGTKYRGYIGYPIISLMMLLGYLPRDREVERLLEGVPWKELNERFKRYQAVLEHIYASLSYKSHLNVRDLLEDYMSLVMSRLRAYQVLYDPKLIKQYSARLIKGSGNHWNTP